MWLMEHNRWTSNKLAKQGMDHPEQCPLCDQHAETINHLPGLMRVHQTSLDRAVSDGGSSGIGVTAD
jgi:hypothetical protein